MNSLITGLKATSVHVNDLGKARAFYGKTLGLREVGFNPEVKSATFEVPNSPVPLAIHQWGAGCDEHHGGRPPGTVSGTILAVANVEQAAEELQRRGARITDAPRKTPFGVLATLADPDGNEFVLTTK